MTFRSAPLRPLLAALLAAPAVLPGPAARAQDAEPRTIACDFAGGSGTTFCLIEQTRLPLRLLTKPRASVYAAPDTTSARVEEGLPTFTELIATDISGVAYDGTNFAPTGWFGVAKVAGQAPIGYVQAQDVVEWHNGLVLTYTNPGVTGRKPVIMFSDAEAL